MDDIEIFEQIISELNIEIKKNVDEYADIYTVSSSSPGQPRKGYVADTDGKITELSLFGHEITTLHNVKHLLTELKRLTKLNLGGNNLVNIDALDCLYNLKELDLAGNSVTDISPLSNLQQLRKLDLSNNRVFKEGNVFKLKDISTLRVLKNLTDLNLSSNEIHDLSPLEELKELQKLSINGNAIEDQALKPLQFLKKLEVLNLNSNQIIDVSFVQHLDKIKQLNLGRNKIFNISPLKELKQLENLDLGKNFIIDTLPLKHLIKLKVLDLSHIKLSNIDHLKDLKNLTILNISDNQINDITSLKDLVKLQQLDLQRNTLTELPEWIIDFSMEIQFEPKEKKEDDWLVYLSSGLIVTPPHVVIKGGKMAIREYFEEMRNEKDYLYEAKLIIVGEAGAGKSTLADAIRLPNFKLDSSDNSSTRGISIAQWVINKDKINTEDNFCFHIWDFGGQEIYHATHQFFLTKRSVYIFVTEARKDFRYEEFYYWLNIINTLALNSPVIVVRNKADEKHSNKSIEEYRNSFPQICADVLLISCNTKLANWQITYKSKLDDLRETIYKILKEKKLIDIDGKLPSAWVQIRKEIGNMQKSGIRYITELAYLKLCDSKGLSKEKALRLSEYFHDLGVFLHFKDDIQLKNIIFIDYEWVTKGIYKVLDNEKIINSFGKFADKELIEIWNEPQFNGKQAELLNLMKNSNFGLCYEHKDGYYLAPQLFSDKQPDYDWHSTKSTIYFSYKYDFMPRGIFSQLLVLMHEYVYNDIFWLHGALLIYKESKALVREDRVNKKLITIQVEGEEKEEKKVLLAIIKSKVEKINKRYDNLSVVEHYGCNCSGCTESNSPNYYEVDKLYKRLQSGRTTIECQHSYEVISIKQLLGDFHNSLGEL